MRHPVKHFIRAGRGNPPPRQEHDWKTVGITQLQNGARATLERCDRCGWTRSTRFTPPADEPDRRGCQGERVKETGAGTLQGKSGRIKQPSNKEGRQ